MRFKFEKGSELLRRSLRCLVHFTIRLPRLPRDALHVLIFGIAFFGAVGLFAGFDADSTAGNPDFEEAAGQGGALYAVAADADGGGLPEEDSVQGADLVFGAENGQLVGRAVFLHENGGEPDVPGSGFEEEINGVAQDFSCAVVDVAFSDP